MVHATSSYRAPAACVDDAVAAFVREKELSLQTLVRLEALMRQFARFIEDGLGVVHLAAVQPTAVERYVSAALNDGSEPGASLRYFCRLAVRMLYRAALRRPRRRGSDDRPRAAEPHSRRVPAVGGRRDRPLSSGVSRRTEAGSSGRCMGAGGSDGSNRRAAVDPARRCGPRDRHGVDRGDASDASEVGAAHRVSDH